MRLSWKFPTAVRGATRWACGAALLAVSLAACLVEVDGDRASSGECPDDEECSDATPAGLAFVGQGYYDDDNPRLGPILAGGSFEVGLRNADGQPLPPFDYQVIDDGIVSAARGEGTFGPTTNEGEPLYEVEGFLTLRAAASGSTHLRVIDPETGELYDRLPLDIYRIEDTKVVNVGEPDRDYLLAGCEEMLGVRLLANNGNDEIRGFDLDVEVRAEHGTISDEPRFWDCILYEPPEDRTEVTLVVEAAGDTFEHLLEVRTLEDEDLDQCPERPRD